MKGKYFKLETLGAVDGPSLRLVLFLQGCPLRCPYCHNPEGWAMDGGDEITVEDVITRFQRHARAYGDGGITVSGGEPLAQADFTRALLERCKREEIHTAMDTSGCVEGEAAIAACSAADMLLLDIKTADPGLHREKFGFPLERVEALLERCDAWGKPVWARQVVAPGISWDKDAIGRLAAFLRPHLCIERVELLPLRGLCIEKYTAMGIPFPMAGAEEPGEDEMAALEALLAALRA